jgi:hypothetical protein
MFILSLICLIFPDQETDTVLFLLKLKRKTLIRDKRRTRNVWHSLPLIVAIDL